MAGTWSPRYDFRVMEDDNQGYVRPRTIKFYVGKTARSFSIHENLLVPRGQWCQEKLKQLREKKRSDLITIDSVDPHIFDIYVDLLYKNNLAVKSSDEESNGRKARKEYSKLCKLYTLSEYLSDQTTKNAIITAIIARAEEPFPDGSRYLPHREHVKIIYEGTKKGDPVQQQLVKFCVESGNGGWQIPEDAPRHFLHDLAVAMLKVVLSQKNIIKFRRRLQLRRNA